VLLALAAGVFLLSESTITGSFSGSAPPVAASHIRTVAYFAGSSDEDVLYLRGLGAYDRPTAIAAFPRSLDVAAHGSAAPGGDRVAVVHVSGAPTTPATLTLVDLPSGIQRDVPTDVDYLTAVAWSANGAQLAVTRTTPGDSPQKQRIAVLEIASATGVATEVAHFDAAHQVAPVGYSREGRILAVVTDQSGSALWQIDRGQSIRIAGLSRGPTRDWALSPDASQLAFVDRLGLGERSYAGRILSIRSRTISDAPLTGDQLGAAWRPGSSLVDFGGPGGSLKLAQPRPGEDYVVPLAWSPDGQTLAATVYSPRRDSGADPGESLELVVGTARLALSSDPGARFLGFVRDP
jgi:hypothetical protein